MTSKNDDNSSNDTSSLASELDLLSLMDSVDTTKEGQGGQPLDEIDQERAEFCDQIEETLRMSKLGYLFPCDLAIHIFEDHSVDSNRLAHKFGFNTFEQFLRSEKMKGRVDIDDSDGITSYHYPMAKIREQNEPVLMAPFLNMPANRKIYQRNGGTRHSECPNNDRLLTKRWYKRNGEVDPEDLKPKKPEPVGRGGTKAMMRMRAIQSDFDNKSTASSSTTRGAFTQPTGRGRGFVVGVKRSGGTWADGKPQGQEKENSPMYCKPGSSSLLPRMN